MQSNTIRICAIVLLVLQAATYAQKTSISVKKGKVVAETGATNVEIEAGRKAVLTPDKRMIVAVNNPLVDDLIDIYKWAEQEKQAQRQLIDKTNLVVFSIEDEDLFPNAYLVEFPNMTSAPIQEHRFGPVTTHRDPSFYDLQGNLLRYESESVDARSSYYKVSLREAVDPGQSFRYICVSNLKAVLGKDGPLWNFRVNYGSPPDRLDYYRFILPDSAIFVDSSKPIIEADSFEGRVAVTVRNYTGQGGEGVTIAFLWPNKDGTSRADLPVEYRGLRSQWEEEIVEEGRRRTAEILAGGTFAGQEDPLETLLSLYSAAVHRDSDAFLALISPNLRDLAARNLDQIARLSAQMVSQQFLSTPAWPEKPEEGYEHPVYLCREGSLICEATLVTSFEKGKWYAGGLELGRTRTQGAESTGYKPSGEVKLLADRPELAAVTYEGLEPGKFMRKWLLLGPVDIPWDGPGYFPDKKTCREFFGVDSLDAGQFEPRVTISRKAHDWKVIESDYGVLNLTNPFDRWFAVAYAWAQVEMPEETTAVLGVGSDDSMKVWLNGELVHEHWEEDGRAVAPDNDRVSVTFKKGKNQLVLKIQNGGGPWGFCCRLLEADSQGVSSP
ncbi:MAG: hypothetical protein JW720_09775 [Sedimentisphaerales bacterium]|nr:hypothetical protein [Sedimentisphaerales bacterium]